MVLTGKRTPASPRRASRESKWRRTMARCRPSILSICCVPCLRPPSRQPSRPAACPGAPGAPAGRTVVIGAGKAAAAMARAVEDHWGDALTGTVVTAQGHAVECRHVEVIESTHPVPTAAGQNAAERILLRVRRLSPDTLVLCLVSGGGSALLPLPAEGWRSKTSRQSRGRCCVQALQSARSIPCVGICHASRAGDSAPRASRRDW